MSNPRSRVKMLFKNLGFATLFCIKKSMMRILDEKFRFEFPQKKNNGFFYKNSNQVRIFKCGGKHIYIYIFYENIKFSYEKYRCGFSFEKKKMKLL